MFFTIILTFAAIYLVFKLVNQHFKFKHIPQPFYQIPFIGGTIGSSIFIVKQKQFEIVDLHQKYGPVMLAGPLGIPTLMIADPVEIKRIHNDTKLFPRSEFLQKLFVGIFEFGLANIASGPLHKVH